MLRSGAVRGFIGSHPVRCLDADKVEAARDDRLRGAAEGEAEALLLALEDAMLVVEAVEVVGDADRVRGDPLRPALRRGVCDDGGGLREPLDQLLLFRRERTT